MKVFWQDPHKLLQLQAECADDLNMLADLLHGVQNQPAPLKGAQWLKSPESELPFACGPGDGITTLTGGRAKVAGCVWDVAQHAAEMLSAQAGREAISALQNVFRLGLGDQTDDLVARLARIEGNLQPQEQLPPALEHLQAMLESLIVEVDQQKAVVNTLMCAHGAPLVVETPIVAQGGVA